MLDIDGDAAETTGRDVGGVGFHCDVTDPDQVVEYLDGVVCDARAAVGPCAPWRVHRPDHPGDGLVDALMPWYSDPVCSLGKHTVVGYMRSVAPKPDVEGIAVQSICSRITETGALPINTSSSNTPRAGDPPLTGGPHAARRMSGTDRPSAQDVSASKRRSWVRARDTRDITVPIGIPISAAVSA